MNLWYELKGGFLQEKALDNLIKRVPSDKIVISAPFIKISRQQKRFIKAEVNPAKIWRETNFSFVVDSKRGLPFGELKKDSWATELSIDFSVSSISV